MAGSTHCRPPVSLRATSLRSGVAPLHLAPNASRPPALHEPTQGFRYSGKPPCGKLSPSQSMRIRFLYPVTAALLLASAPTFAKGKSAPDQSTTSQADRQAREREARGACLNGDYARGVGLLSDLFLDFKDPGYIFNQGRCYEQNQRFREAIGRFREYLRTGTEDRALAEKHIAECEALQKQTSPPASAPATETALPPPAPVQAAQPGSAADVRQQPPTTSSGSGLRIAGAVIAGVGGAGLIAGIVLNLKANSLADSIDPPGHTFDRNTESTRQNYEIFSWVGYGVGAAGIAMGAILYGIGWWQSGRAGDVALIPMIGSELAGATIKGTF